MYKETKQEKHIEKEYNKYCAWVYQYAEEIFDAIILPYLQKYKLTFISGNGTYYIGCTEMTPKWFVTKYEYRNGSIFTDKLPKRIQGVLDSEVFGMDNCFGSLMPTYNG